MGENMGSFSDILSLARNNDGCNGGGWLWFIVIIALLFGWGNGGYGGYGGNGALTRAELYDSQGIQSILGNQNQAQRDLCQVASTLSNQLTNATYTTQNVVQNGFNNMGNAICSLGYENQTLFNGIGRQIDQLRFDNQTNTTALLESNNAQTQRIIDKLNEQEVNALKSENAMLRSQNQALNLQVSQEAQTACIINTLSPKAPVPAFNVPAPWYTTNQCCGC